MQKIVDVEYDPVEEMVYWMDAELKRIRRARLNGTGFEVSLFAQPIYQDFRIS